MILRTRLWLSFFLLLLCACEDLERNNPLDPRNPRSERRRVVFVEAFVNDGTPFSSFALAAVDSLAAAFSPEQIVIAEHHLPSVNFTDLHALAESNERYNNFVAPGERGVPDVFFNGSLARVQGASSARNALSRYRSAAQAEFGKVAHFTIEAKKNLSSAGIDIAVTIARLGDSDFEQFEVLALVFEDLSTAGHHRVVRKIFPPEKFSRIEAGEKKSVRFAANLPASVNATRLQAVVVIEHTSGFGREVLQTVLAE